MKLVPVDYVAQSLAGDALNGATVTVRDGEAPGAGTLATIYSDAAGTSLANPATTTANGTLRFWVEPGKYNLTASGSAESVVIHVSNVYNEGVPLIVLVSGQSNADGREAISPSWTVPKNFKGMWSYLGSGYTNAGATTTVGTFEVPDGSESSFGLNIGERMAVLNPSRPVYVINVAKGGLAIAQWLSGASDPNMMTALQNNVSAALTEISTAEGVTVTQVDALVWWQGESDANGAPQNTDYVSDFDTFHTQLRAESWFDQATPVMICGISPHGSIVREEYNKYLKATVAAEPETRTFFDPGQYPIALWDSDPGVNYVHMIAEGYRLAGNAAADEFERGGMSHIPGVVYSPYLDTYSFGIGTVPNSFWDWTFEKTQDGSSYLAVNNTDVGDNATAGVILNTGGADLDIVALNSGAARVKSTGAGNFDIDAGNASGSLRLLHDGVQKVRIGSAGNVEVADGVTFGGGSDALDHYEEGTWTPVIADATSGGNTGTFSASTATFTRTGRMVHVLLKLTNINTSGMTAGNDVYIRGLPYAAGADWNVPAGSWMIYGVSTSGTLSAYPIASNTYFTLQEQTATSYDNLIVSEITSGGNLLRGSFTYYTDA